MKDMILIFFYRPLAFLGADKCPINDLHLDLFHPQYSPSRTDFIKHSLEPP